MVTTLLIGVSAGIALGAGFVLWKNKTAQHKRRRIPREWPLKLRPLVNSSERRVWIWLAKSMFDHQILVKLPVTRFTTPSEGENAAHWYQLLNGVYCTFTVCAMDGRVVGCIDVQSPKGLSMSNQNLKHTLLTQCGVQYLVVEPTSLPHITKIRTAILGDQAITGSDQGPLGSRFKDVSQNLHAAVTRQRQSKSNQFSRLDIDLGDTSAYQESRMSSGWEQNSFVTPLDSRLADLSK